MGFLAPWFLGGLAALGVPVFVHLLRKHITHAAAGKFADVLRARHAELDAPSAAALSVACSLCDLRWCCWWCWHLQIRLCGGPLRTPTAALLLIVLDNSFSMRAGTRFADAKQQALAALAAKPHSQKAQIMALGGQLEVMTQPIDDEAQLRAALESIQPGDGHANFGELGRAIRTMSETVHGPIDLHLFSDMQRSAMPANFADMVFPGNVTLLLHPVAEGAAPPNWTVESVDAPAELSDPKDPKRSRVQAVVAGFGTPAATKTVSLVVNGKVIATKKVDVPANGRATVEFAPLDVAMGSIAARCGSRAAMHSRPTMPATLWCGGPILSGFCSSIAAGDPRSALYFDAALQAAAQASFVLQSVAAEQATDLDPSKFAFVVLSDTVVAALDL